jgi:hypothetical protein
MESAYLILLAAFILLEVYCDCAGSVECSRLPSILKSPCEVEAIREEKESYDPNFRATGTLETERWPDLNK